MPLSTINNGASSATARANINAAITGLNNASGPDVIYVSSIGNDTTGDGSLAKPFLTAQKGFDIGQATSQPFMLDLSVGYYSIINQASSGYLKTVRGQSEQLTTLSFNASAPAISNDNGANGGVITLCIQDIHCLCYVSGGNVTVNDGNSYTPGNGGEITLTGHGIFSAYASGGSIDASASTGGNGGTINLSGSLTLKDGELAAGGGSSGGGTGTAGAEGTITADGCNLRGLTSVAGYTTFGRCSYGTAISPSNNVGGNAVF